MIEQNGVIIRTMSAGNEPLEQFWDNLLSRQPDQIREAFASIDPEVRRHVLDHLHRMISEEGWHPEQRASAQAALETLEGPK